MTKKIIYLDYAAATPMDDGVLLAIKPYFAGKFYNPSANYLPANEVKNDITEAKKSIAGLIGAKHSEIIHTSGGSESNNLAVSGIMDLFPSKKLLISSIEHESVLNPAKKYNSELIPVDKHGILNLAALEKLIDDDVVLISVMLANNEIGSVQPIRKVAEIVKRIRQRRIGKKSELPLYLHTDACQAPGYMNVNTNSLGVDLMTLNGGKLYGPKQSGILFVKSGVSIEPQILGGGQQRNLRSGTENPASVVGFARALDIAVEKREAETLRLQKLRSGFIVGLLGINPAIVINGHPKKHLPHILNAAFPGFDNERLLFRLEDAGILAASGSACSASSSEPSHVLRAMGLSDETARSSLRFSFGRDTKAADISRVVSSLKLLIK